MSHKHQPEGLPASLSEAARTIDALIDTLQQPITMLKNRFLQIYDDYFNAEGINASRLERLAAELEPQCLRELDTPVPRFTDGIGLVWLAPTGASGMLWWRAEADRVARKHHVFNPSSDSFYDYRNSSWFLGAYEASGLSIVGPYVDAWGTDDHTLTGSIAMRRPAGSAGVAAADLNLGTVVSHVERALTNLPGTVLVNNEDRVVASNIALLTPGLPLMPYLSKSSKSIVATEATTLMNWRLLEVA